MPTNTTTPEAATTTTPATPTTSTPLSAMTGEEVASIIVGLIRQNDGVLIQQKVTDGINQSEKVISADTKMTQMVSQLQQIINANVIHPSLDGYSFSKLPPVYVADLFQNRSLIIEVDDDNFTSYTDNVLNLFPNAKKVRLDNLTTNSVPSSIPYLFNSNAIEELYIKNLVRLQANRALSCPLLKVLDIKNLHIFDYENGSSLDVCPNLIDIVWGGALAESHNFLVKWSPTNALLNSTNNLVPESVLTEHPSWKNLDYLLYNIRRHIAANLNSSVTATLTFSAAVGAAIDADQETKDSFPASWTILY